MTALDDHDRMVIARARELAEARGIEAARKAAGSASDAIPAVVYAEAFGVARVRLGDLLAIIGRLDTREDGTDDV